MEIKDNIKDQDSTQQAEKILPKRKNTRKRSIIIFTVVSLLNAALLALLWSQLLTPANPSESQAGASDNNAVNPLQGHTAPNFTLAALSGSRQASINLASFKGKAIVLNFWASTCAPCAEESPMLQATWQRMQAKNVVFIGVDFQDPRSDGVSFLRKYNITYLNVLDSDGATAIHYGVTFTPTTFFINRQGVIVNSIPREMTAQELQRNLQALT